MGASSFGGISTTAPIGEVDAPETDSLAVCLREVAVLDADDAVLAGGSVEQERYVGRRRTARAVVHHKGSEQGIVPLRPHRGENQKEEGKRLACPGQGGLRTRRFEGFDLGMDEKILSPDERKEIRLK